MSKRDTEMLRLQGYVGQNASYRHLTRDPCQFELVIDEFENDAGRRARDKRFVGYGQIQAFIHTTLQANTGIRIKEDVPTITALVRMCKTDGEDASIKPIKYKDGDMGAVRAFSVATIDCVIGCVKMWNWWGILDRSSGPLRITIYDIQEPEYESEDSLSISCGM